MPEMTAESTMREVQGTYITKNFSGTYSGTRQDIRPNKNAGIEMQGERIREIARRKTPKAYEKMHRAKEAAERLADRAHDLKERAKNRYDELPDGCKTSVMAATLACGGAVVGVGAPIAAGIAAGPAAPVGIAIGVAAEGIALGGCALAVKECRKKCKRPVEIARMDGENYLTIT